MKPIDQIKKLALRASVNPPKPWLPLNANSAFMCCIGAGPWRYGRRRKIQMDGLMRLGPRDLSDLRGTEKWFPLDWQNSMLNNLTRYLRTQRPYRSMPMFVRTLQNVMLDSGSIGSPREQFFRACGHPEGTKVLSLFLRDYVGIPSFPVDRHVRRALQDMNLPTKEQELLDLCGEAGVDPIPVARMLGTDRLDGGNPNWSEWPDQPAPERSK